MPQRLGLRVLLKELTLIPPNRKLILRTKSTRIMRVFALAQLMVIQGGKVKRIPAGLLILLSFAWSAPAHAQIYRGPNSAKQSQKAASKYQKRVAKQQRKAAKKLAKAQRNAAKRQKHNRAWL